MTALRCAVLGSPIGHSLSPVLHRAAYGELGLGWRYDAIEIHEAELAGFLAGIDDEWRGLSLTMPLKRTVIALLDDPDPLVTSTGVANTVVLNKRRRAGFNTDIPGAANAIREQTSAPVTSAAVLGGGATAASLGWALADLGCTSLRLFVRSPETAAETVAVIREHPRHLEVEVCTLAELEDLEHVDIVASTIPASAQDEALVANLDRSGASTVFDVVYDPWPTPLAAWAGGTHRTLISGLDLLVHQAALQVQLMTGRGPSVSVMRTAGQRALADGSRA